MEKNEFAFKNEKFSHLWPISYEYYLLSPLALSIDEFIQVGGFNPFEKDSFTNTAYVMLTATETSFTFGEISSLLNKKRIKNTCKHYQSNIASCILDLQKDIYQ